MSLYGKASMAFIIENINVACEGGWGINPYFAIRPDCYLPLKGFIGLRFRGYANSVPRPLFTPFADSSLHRRGFDGRIDDILRARMLGDAIPSESFATGANRDVLHYGMYCGKIRANF